MISYNKITRLARQLQLKRKLCAMFQGLYLQYKVEFYLVVVIESASGIKTESDYFYRISTAQLRRLTFVWGTNVN